MRAFRIEKGVSARIELEPGMEIFSQTKGAAVLIRLKPATQERIRIEIYCYSNTLVLAYMLMF
jgi:hypothetical protein